MDSYDDFEDLQGDDMISGMVNAFMSNMPSLDELVHKAFNDTYDLITEKITFEELIVNNMKSPGVLTITLHDIDKGPTEHLLKMMIKHYTNLEEYEKCAVLHKMLPV
jgi:hypothetical protein